MKLSYVNSLSWPINTVSVKVWGPHSKCPNKDFPVTGGVIISSGKLLAGVFRINSEPSPASIPKRHSPCRTP